MTFAFDKRHFVALFLVLLPAMRIADRRDDSAGCAPVVDGCPFLYDITVAPMGMAANPVPHLVVGVSG